MSGLNTLTSDEVIYIHDLLTEDAKDSEDPISPSGIKDRGLLDSAISRQLVGFGGKLKYSDPIENAATLCYGICSNHPLYNGNKRTALVSMICHLDKNGFTFTNRADQNVLYTFMLNVAKHDFAKKKRKLAHDQSDTEVIAMAQWIRKKTRKYEKGERLISFPELEKILKCHNIYVEQKGNTADLFKRTEVKAWFGRTKTKEERVATSIPWWPGRSVGKNLIKSIRKQASLTVDDGVDSHHFYNRAEITPDDYIQRYKTVLRKLAKT